MPVVPANCLTRKELHALVNRSDELHRSCAKDKVLADAFKELLTAAANLDGVLAERGVDAGNHPNHKQVFDDAWPHQWLGGYFTLHGSGRDMTVAYEQQILKRPGDNAYIGTGRFRLKLGAETHYGSPAELRLLLERHFTMHEDVVPAKQRETILGHLFAKEGD